MFVVLLQIRGSIHRKFDKLFFVVVVCFQQKSGERPWGITLHYNINYIFDINEPVLPGINKQVLCLYLICQVIGRIFHRLASASTCSKFFMSFIIHILSLADATGQVNFAVRPLDLSFHFTTAVRRDISKSYLYTWDDNNNFK